MASGTKCVATYLPNCAVPKMLALCSEAFLFFRGVAPPYPRFFDMQGARPLDPNNQTNKGVGVQGAGRPCHLKKRVGGAAPEKEVGGRGVRVEVQTRVKTEQAPVQIQVEVASTQKKVSPSRKGLSDNVHRPDVIRLLRHLANTKKSTGSRVNIPVNTLQKSWKHVTHQQSIYPHIHSGYTPSK